MSVADAVEALESHPEVGLSEAEAAARLNRHGPNSLPAARRAGPLRRFLRQFANVLIYVLLAAAVASALLGEWVDMAVIMGVVLLNALIGCLQEGKAERALEAIRDMLAPTATVVRDRSRMTVAARELTPGDLVLLKAGDKAPADLRLVDAQALALQEAILTGEALATDKQVGAVPPEAPLGDRSSMVFAGTTVTQGTGAGLVTVIGRATEIGRITGLMAAVERLETPLMRQMAGFGRVLTIAILALAAATGVYGVAVAGFAPTEMFMAAVGLAVAAIPEGLPAIVTIALAIGVTRMARRNAIIRRLPAVETLGAVSVICTDKTGTLTQNRLAARLVETAEGVLAWSEMQRGDLPETVRRLLRAGALCNDGEAERADDGWRFHGNPTDQAFLRAAVVCGVDPAESRRRAPRDAVLPFDSRHKYMVTRHPGIDGEAGGATLYVKGAPEAVLARCTHIARDGGAEPIDRDRWTARLGAHADEGLRMLALAEKRIAGDFETDGGALAATDADGLTFLGCVGLEDPPRPEAARAIADCRAAGIAVKMVTGDHAGTAMAIGRQLGLDAEAALTGSEIDAMDDAALRVAARDHAVFARTSPEHKIRLVKALQAEGRIVAMTGDGVNDAAALKSADVGTAMGINGTEAAKEAADMVLADDNFASIAHAVEEGRTVYDNLVKSILFILPTSFGAALLMVAAVLAEQALPLTATQILWVNMITTVTLALAIGFEPPEHAVMRRHPRAPGAPLLSAFLLWRIAFVSAIIVGGCFVLFHGALAAGRPVEAARTLTVTALVVVQCFYLLNARRLTGGLLSRDRFTGNRLVWVAIAATLAAQAVFVFAPPMQALFASAPLTAVEWLGAGALGLALWLLVGVESWAVARWTAARALGRA